MVYSISLVSLSHVLVQYVLKSHTYTVASSVAEPKLFIFGSGSSYNHILAF